PGMRRAQRALADFLPQVDWLRFRRKNLNDEVTVSHPAAAVFACGDGEQTLAWVLRRDTIGRNGMLRDDVSPLQVEVRVPGIETGRYRVTCWDTKVGEVR